MFVPFSKTAEPEPVLWVVVGAVLRFWTRVASWSGVSDMAVGWRRVAAIVFVSGGWGTDTRRSWGNGILTWMLSVMNGAGTKEGVSRGHVRCLGKEEGGGFHTGGGTHCSVYWRGRAKAEGSREKKEVKEAPPLQIFRSATNLLPHP